MSTYKSMGACTQCDVMCFTVLETAPDGTPKRLGPVKTGVVRIAFMLMDGSQMNLTFCADCATDITSDAYAGIWTKVMNSWVREIGDKPLPDWFQKQYANGLLSEMGRTNLKDAAIV